MVEDKFLEEKVYTLLKKLVQELEVTDSKLLIPVHTPEWTRQQKLQHERKLGQGRSQFKLGGGGGFRPTLGKPTPALEKRWYCDIPGHVQARCRKKEKEGGSWAPKPKIVDGLRMPKKIMASAPNHQKLRSLNYRRVIVQPQL